jgi:hypothetical protein
MFTVPFSREAWLRADCAPSSEETVSRAALVRTRERRISRAPRIVIQISMFLIRRRPVPRLSHSSSGRMHQSPTPSRTWMPDHDRSHCLCGAAPPGRGGRVVRRSHRGAAGARRYWGATPQNGSGRAGPEFLGAPTSATDSWSGEADLPEERPVVPEQVLLNDPAE